MVVDIQFEGATSLKFSYSGIYYLMTDYIYEYIT